jgi:PAS domain S-box-containing protein
VSGISSELRLSAEARSSAFGALQASFVWTPSHDRVGISRAFAQQFGLPVGADQLSQDQFFALFDAKDAAILRERLHGAAADAVDTLEIDVRAQRPDSERIVVRVRCLPHRDPAGDSVHVIAVCFDITELERQHKNLADHRARSTAMLTQTRAAFFEFDRSLVCTHYSHEGEGLLGARNEMTLGLPLERMLHDPIALHLLREVAEGRSEGFEDVDLHLSHADGGRRWMRWSAFPLLEDGACIGVRVMSQDVGAAKEAEHAHAQSEQRLQDVARLTGLIWFELDASFVFTFMSEGCADLIGIPGREAIGETPFTLAGADNPQELASLWLEKRAARRVVVGEAVPFRKADGKVIWLSLSLEALTDSGGEIIGYRGSARDITTERLALKALRDSEARFAGMAAISGECVVELDATGRYTFVSSASQAVFGVPADEMIGRSPVEFVVGAESVSPEAWMNAFAKAGAWVDRENLTHTPDGKRRWLRSNAEILRWPDGTVRGARGSVRDVTAAHEAAASIADNEERLRTLAAFTGWAWYELNTDFDLTYVSDNARAVTGLSVEELVGRSMWDFLDLPRNETEPGLVAALHGPDGHVEAEAPYRFTPDAPHRWYKVQVRTLRDREGRIIGYRGYSTDITALREARLAIEETGDRLRDMAEFSGWVWFELSPDWRYTYVSPNARAVVGVEAAGLIGKPAGALQVEDAAIVEKIGRALIARDGAIRKLEVLHAARNGLPERWFRVSMRPILDAEGNITGYRGVCGDIDAEKRGELRLQASERRFADVVDTLGEMIFELDHDRRFTYLSPQYAREYGYDLKEMLGKSPPILERATGSIDRETGRLRVHNGETAAFEGRFTDGFGRDRWVRVSMRARLGPDGQVIGYLGSSSDITHRKAQEQALQHAMEEAQAAARAKADFLATMSHEIRTPLNAVIGMTELLLDTPLSPRQCEFARSAHTAGRHLLTLVNDILDVSKLEAGKLDLETRPFDLVSEAGAAAEMLRRAAENKGLKLVLGAEAGLPAWVAGDAARVRQILVNFISNAVKFTDAGSVRLDLSRTASGAIRFSVTDTGCGIAPDILGGLFQDFAQGGVQVSRTHGGTGLGLAISRRLAELMGGCVGASSQLGEGSVFWAEIPLAESAAPSAEGGVVSRPASRTRVLVAEDNKANQLLVRALLDRMGCVVTLVENGAEAVDAVRASPFDVVLMDMQMPVMDGEAATIAIRALPEGRDLPILALTADVSTDTRGRLMAAGMSDYLTKPIDARRLAAALAHWTQPGADKSPHDAAPRSQTA